MQPLDTALGLSIIPGLRSDTTADTVQFTPVGMDHQVAIENTLQHQPEGLRTCATSLGLKRSGQPDFTVITLPQPGQAAAVFTQSLCPSYTVMRNRACIADGTLQAVAVNSGNANVFTPHGMQDLARIADLVAREFHIVTPNILICSTGVMGVPLPIEKFEAGIPGLSQTMREGNLQAAATAILTSDVGPKVASVALDDVVLCGIAKGAGMIEPHLATMLVYFFTNAQLDAPSLRAALIEAVDVSFNRISIDAETSPGDTVALLSTGTVPVRGVQVRHFRQALNAMAVKLARDIVSQGEGVTRMLEVMVDSDVSVQFSRRIAKNVINSLLVKTAAHGATPQWGPIVAALGKPDTGPDAALMAPTQISIALQSHVVYQRGEVVRFDEQALQQALHTNPIIRIHVTIRAGGYLGHAWGSDLSAEYVRLNAGGTTSL